MNLLKIQVMLEDWPGHKGLPWADLENLPKLESYDQARTWMAENGCEKLQVYGVRFRIVPVDVASESTVALEGIVTS